MVAFVREANDVFVVVVVVVFVLLLLKEEEQKEEEEEEEEEGKAVLRVDDVEKKSSREEAFIEESSVRGVCVRVCAMRGEECGGSDVVLSLSLSPQFFLIVLKFQRFKTRFE
jgi:hypothetical protein